MRTARELNEAKERLLNDTLSKMVGIANEYDVNHGVGDGCSYEIEDGWFVIYFLHDGEAEEIFRTTNITKAIGYLY